MKKILSLLLGFTSVICIVNQSYAADEYSFELNYTGMITENEPKQADVKLIGKNGTLYSKVIIKIDVEGPEKPKITAKDTSGIEHDIVDLGYWGPQQGFAVQGDFTNTTPVTATFYKAGNYKITLSLINLENSNSVIVERTFDIVVNEKEQVANNTTNNVISNNTTNNTSIEELPKTGMSVFEYIILICIAVIALSILGIYIKKRKYEK